MIIAGRLTGPCVDGTRSCTWMRNPTPGRDTGPSALLLLLLSLLCTSLLVFRTHYILQHLDTGASERQRVLSKFCPFSSLWNLWNECALGWDLQDRTDCEWKKVVLTTASGFFNWSCPVNRFESTKKHKIGIIFSAMKTPTLMQARTQCYKSPLYILHAHCHISGRWPGWATPIIDTKFKKMGV